MTQFLPPNLLALFAAREPIPFLPPACKLPHEKKQKGYDGVGHFLTFFEHPSETPPPTRVETRAERIERRRRERAEQTAYKLEQEIALWKPADDQDATVDPFKTLFVARINYDTSESKLRREFEGYGAIKKIKLTFNQLDGKPRGYAFIEYEHERDMHSAYKHADGKKIDGKRVLVDVERARTVKGWLPRRLGGGLGGTRRGGADVNIKHSGREDNERERERYRMEREREEGRGGRGGDRGDRDRVVSSERVRRRTRSRSPRRRSRSPRRREPREPREAREPREPRDRERDKEREKERERERERDKPREPKEEDADKKDRRRKRSRSRSERRRERRERDKDRGERGERDKDRDKERKRSRRDKERKEPKVKTEDIKIKEEPADDYPEYGLPVPTDSIKQEQDAGNGDENKYNPEEPNGDDYAY